MPIANLKDLESPRIPISGMSESDYLDEDNWKETIALKVGNSIPRAPVPDCRNGVRGGEKKTEKAGWAFQLQWTTLSRRPSLQCFGQSIVSQQHVACPSEHPVEVKESSMGLMERQTRHKGAVLWPERPSLHRGQKTPHSAGASAAGCICRES